MDSFNLVGLEENVAKNILLKNGYNNIKTIINSKYNEKCNKIIVCAVKISKDLVTLICGNFYIIY